MGGYAAPEICFTMHTGICLSPMTKKHNSLQIRTLTILIGLILTTAVSCKKDTAEKENEKAISQGASYFQAGKGFRYLTTLKEGNGGRASFFKSRDLTFTADNKIQWVVDRTNPFGSKSFLYRKTLNATSGDTLPTEGNLDKIDPLYRPNPYGGNDFVRFVPYTNKLYLSYRTGQVKYNVTGDVPDFEKGGYDGYYNRPTLYTNGDVMMQYSGNISVNYGYMTTVIGANIWHLGLPVVSAKVDSTFMSYGNFLRYDRLYHGGVVYPSDNNGNTLAFGYTDNKAYLFKRSGARTSSIDSVDFAGEPFPAGRDPLPSENLYKFRSTRDLKTTVILTAEPDRKNKSGNYYFSSFVINNETGKIRLIVNKKLLTGRLYGSDIYDVDTDGTIYYGLDGENGATTQVIKVTPGGETVVGDGFITTQRVNGLYVFDGKVYVTAVTSAGEHSTISLFVSQ